MSVKNEKSKASVKSTMEKIKDSFVRFLKPAASANRRLCAVVCNTDGAATAMDIALDLVIGVVLLFSVLLLSRGGRAGGPEKPVQRGHSPAGNR